ncbi:glycosyltransferase family 2 protein, partial [Pedobacter sp.]
MREFLATFETIFNNAIFYYAIFVMGSYLILTLLSAIEMSGYIRKNSYVNYREILVSPLAPSVSILAPAYNEEATIIENIRSLLSLHYGHYEVIIINDGSKDGTFQQMFDYYKLEKVDFVVNYQIKCNEIRGVYKSKLPSFSKLTVVDKVNGGKSDALNAGIN